MVPAAHTDSESGMPSLGLNLDLINLEELFKGTQQLHSLSPQNDIYDLPWSFPVPSLLPPATLPSTRTISPKALHQPSFFDFIDGGFSTPSSPELLATAQLSTARVLPASPITDSDSSSDNSESPVPSSTATTLLTLPSDPEISDLDAYGISDDEKDEDYLPSSSRSTPRRRQSQPAPASRRKAKSTTPPPRSPRKAPYSTPRRARTAPPSRVHQVSGELAELMRSALSRTDVANSLNYTCPDALCGFKMKTKPRMPDFRRHLRAHLREADSTVCRGHVCKGILLEEFEALPEWKQESIRSNDRGGTPYLLSGETRIGGCRQSFSRGDALTRHVKSRTNACVGFVSHQLEGCH
ncbi:hypothetical protein H1R20_g1958, partial [Candolleomyces eurysporus]